MPSTDSPAQYEPLLEELRSGQATSDHFRYIFRRLREGDVGGVVYTVCRVFGMNPVGFSKLKEIELRNPGLRSLRIVVLGRSKRVTVFLGCKKNGRRRTFDLQQGRISVYILVRWLLNWSMIPQQKKMSNTVQLKAGLLDAVEELKARKLKADEIAKQARIRNAQVQLEKEDFGREDSPFETISDLEDD